MMCMSNVRKDLFMTATDTGQILDSTVSEQNPVVIL